MKKSKRTWLLLAGASSLSAALLVPTVLSACSTTPPLTEEPGDDNNNTGPGDGNNNGGTGGDGSTDQNPTPNKLAKELEKLNNPANASARKNIYSNYFKAINKITPESNPTTRLANLNPPTLSPVSVTPLFQIVQQSGFFDQLIKMINSGLDVGGDSANGQISNDELTTLIGKLKSEISSLNSTGRNPVESKPESIWSPEAFEFADVDTPTWTLISQDKNTKYELFLTENVDFVFDSTVDKVSVKVVNKAGNSKVKSRLVESTKTNSGTPSGRSTSESTNTPTWKPHKTYNFKSNADFVLPSLLFNDFDKYVDAFDKDMKLLMTDNYLQSATDKYKKLTTDSSKGFISAASLWNQFAGEYEEILLNTMISDLNTRRTNSSVYKWIKENVTESDGILEAFKNDLQAAMSVNLAIDTLTIKGQQADNNGINSADDELSDYTLIISFEAEKAPETQESKTPTNNDVPLDDKWYVLNLKATGFEFNNKINSDFFGYQNSSFVTTPKLKLDAKSSFASYRFTETGNTAGGLDEVTVEKLKNTNLKNQNNFVDVSGLYDINGTGFTAFLSNLVIDRSSESTKLTDKLLDLNANQNSSILEKFKEYSNTSAIRDVVRTEILKPNVLADLILENIDISNAAWRSVKLNSYGSHTATDNLPQKNISFMNGNTQINSWKEAINFWVSGSSVNAKPGVWFKPDNPSENDFDGLSSKIRNKADITITSNRHNHIYKNLKLGNNLDFEFKTIYIFLGNSANQSNSIVNAFNADNGNVSLSTNSNETYPINPSVDTSWDDILTKVQDKFCIIFEKARSSSSSQSTKTPPLYAFYMGQGKTNQSNIKTSNQTRFPIILDKLIVDESKFLEMLFPADAPSQGRVLTDAILPRSFREIK